MRQLKKATKAYRRHLADSEPVLRAPASDPYSTPWDEPTRYWGHAHAHGPLRASRKAYHREKLLGTW